MLQIYNTLTKQKEEFKPLIPNQVGLYVCGVTVYDHSHIGHARVYMAFDMVTRYLRYRGYKVKYLRNITDIDDKIIIRANANNEPTKELAKRFIEAMHHDFAALNILPPDEEPRATEYIPQMISLIKTLIDKGYAYVGTTGDVYYDVQKFETYGCLSHRDLDDLQAGSRVDVNEAKRNPLDFVLWKMAKPDEPSWHSPWGKGRPGWHIECSAMSIYSLGDTFDIHGGGPDLIFPHHENERAQSEAATGQPFVKTWMHVGFVQKDKEKMAKSVGNFVTIRDFLKEFHPEALRYFTLSSHYRSPVDYAIEHINVAEKALERFYTALRGLKEEGVQPLDNSEFEKRFIEAMDDDFNTPEAFAVLFDLVREINSAKEQDIKKAESLGALLRKLGNILGLLYENAENFLRGNTTDQNEVEEIEHLIKMRNEARASKNWGEADKIRKMLMERNIILEDNAEGTSWRSLV